MMHLAAQLLPDCHLHVFTVDHGLRAEAADEIALVAAQAQALGLSHDVRSWTWDGNGNLQAAARAGRWQALCEMAKARNVTTVWMGHTEDDQVETAMMRLARGSGVDGLRGIYPQANRDGIDLFRPVLGLTRADLRTWLQQRGVAWCEDPSNMDPRFDRVRARQMFTQLADLGLTRKRVLQTIDHMQAAHHSLQEQAQSFARAHIRQDAGDLIIAPPALELDKSDAPRRVMAAAFGWVSSKSYRPRFEQLLETVSRAKDRMTVTLGGCILLPETGGQVRLTREAAATLPLVWSATTGVDNAGATWDQRWYLEGPIRSGLTFRALGEGVGLCPQWRDTGIPRMSLLGSPSVWDGETLIAAPLAGLSQGWSARIVADFHSTAFAIED
jgi:tRNA(Ile)-lysidine synthase